MRYAAALLCATVMAGCAGAPGAPPVVERHAELPHFYGIAEANLNMQGGATIHWTWTASHALEFNIHAHNGTSVVYLYSATGTSNAGEFYARTPGGYSLMWNNTADGSATLDYRIDGDATFDSAYPPEGVA